MSKLQNEDFKTEAEIILAGGSSSQLMNDTKIYVTANGLNKTLSQAIIDNNLGGGGASKKVFDMKLNGAYGGAAAYNGVDGLWIAPNALQITNIFIYQDTPGSGGTTTLDLKVKPFLSGSFTSVFLTTPKVNNAAGSHVWCGVGDAVGGFTAPVLTSLPFAVAAKSALRMDLLGAQSGAAAGVGLIIVYEDL